jgi:ABC-2 type transport system permease protein
VSAVSATTLLAGRALRRYLRSPPALISSLLFPVLLLFVQVAAFGRIVGAAFGQDYVERITPLVILTTSSFAATVTAVGLFDDLRGGLFDRLRTMPLPPWSLLAGRVLGDLVRIVAVAAVAAAVAHVVGFRFRQGVPATLAFFGVVALFGLFVTWIGTLAALTLASVQTIRTVLGEPSTLLFFLSTGFVPLAAFPGFLRPFVRVNPMSVVTDTLVGLSSGGTITIPLLGTLGWTLGAGGLCAVLSARRFSRLARRR